MRRPGSFVLCFAALLCRAAAGQSVQVGDATFALAGIRSDDGARPASEWAAFAGNAKTTALISWTGTKLGVAVKPDTRAAFTTTTVVRAVRSGVSVYTDLEARLTFVPLAFQSTSRSYPRASAVLMLCRYVSTPSLSYPRLLIRYDGTRDWMIEEIAFRKDGRATTMTAKYGDCLMRSGLRLLQQRNGIAYASLDSVLRVNAREPLASSLRRVYDVRNRPVGQSELTLYSALLITSNLEEEFDAGYISGSITAAFKPDRKDSWYVAQIKSLAESVFKDLLKKAGSALWSVIVGWLGF